MTSLSKAPGTWLDDRSVQGASLWLLVWASVVFVGLFSFYVHLLHEQVERGERWRQAQRGAAQTGRVGATLSADEARQLPAAILTANLH